jgi:hypothetical protein
MRLKSNLTKIAQTAPAAAKKARIETAKDIGSLAQQLAPEDTGELKGSLDFEHEENVSRVGFTAIHAPFQEYGFIHYKSDEHVEAQPFLTPAFAQTTETFKANLLKEMENLA